MSDPCPSARAASREIRAGRLSAEALIESCLARIGALEPRICAWVTVDREGALACARARDRELGAGRWRGPLHGIPIAVKDIFDTAGLLTTAGSPLLADFVPTRDAQVVARLREAGAVVLGKTRTSQFACTDPAGTHNPWDLEHTPGGSSSGSAAAVACGMAPLALGTQTGGSVSRPAAYCGVVGVKPTFGRSSRRGVIEVSHGLDHVGAFGRDLADTALLLDAIAGPDPEDPFCLREPAPAYAAALDQEQRRAPRLGRVQAFDERVDASARAALERASELFVAAGADLENIPWPEPYERVLGWHLTVMCAEAAAVHAEDFERAPEAYQPGIRGLLERGRALPAPTYAAARRHQVEFRPRVLAAFADCDALLTPAAPGPAPRDLSTTGSPELNSPWSFTGLPTVVLPVQLSADGLPLALQLTGRPDAESDLMRVAQWCERALGFDARPAPAPSGENLK